MQALPCTAYKTVGNVMQYSENWGGGDTSGFRCWRSIMREDINVIIGLILQVHVCTHICMYTRAYVPRCDSLGFIIEYWNDKKCI